MKILITGGAGFIGSNITKKLADLGHEIVVLDNLNTDVHGKQRNSYSSQLAKHCARIYEGDIRDPKIVRKCLKDVNAVLHLAALTGTGQSMYLEKEYIDVNIIGTEVLMKSIKANPGKIKRIVVSSTRAIYGEGKYICPQHGDVYPRDREPKKMNSDQYDPVCPKCDGPISVTSTDEYSQVHPKSIYAITKYAQEQLLLSMADVIGIPAIALRYQNVYGPGQSLNNPYTGILSIFSTMILNGNCINIYEDGQESRDFIHVEDVSEATVRALMTPNLSENILNVGSGKSTNVIRITELLSQHLGREFKAEITGDFRIGDIRHNYAEISKLVSELKFKPNINIEDGIADFISWVKSQNIQEDKYKESENMLRSQGILKN